MLESRKTIGSSEPADIGRMVLAEDETKMSDEAVYIWSRGRINNMERKALKTNGIAKSIGRMRMKKKREMR